MYIETHYSLPNLPEPSQTLFKNISKYPFPQQIPSQIFSFPLKNPLLEVHKISKQSGPYCGGGNAMLAPQLGKKIQ